MTHASHPETAIDTPAIASPRDRYAADLQQPGFSDDPAQAAVVDALQAIHDRLLATPPRWFQRRWRPVTGLYLWGGVGRGKTYLMDCFYETLPLAAKRRTHFHRFMQEVHARRRRYRNRRDPLALIARDMARERVLCFDEFFVSDIADAMILGRLTEKLFARGVTLVATSNIPPDRLYEGGLQRERFLPAIDRIKRHCRVMHLDSDTDYRLRVLERAEIYHWPLDEGARRNMESCFRDIAPEPGEPDTALEINGREIPARRLADGVVWFDFEDLCASARSTADYAELARYFHTVLLERVPIMDADADDAARRFIHLVDEFYDRQVKLIVSAEADPASLYAGKRLGFEYRRTLSRLHEMASHEYLALPHLP